MNCFVFSKYICQKRIQITLTAVKVLCYNNMQFRFRGHRAASLKMTVKGGRPMSKEVRKRLFSFVFFFGILGLSCWYIFHDENLNRVVYYLGKAKLIYVAPAVVAVIAFILGESVVICYLLNKLGSKPIFSHCCLYSFIGFFYSSITPSASGGQPMQVVAMRRDGIPTAISAMVLAIVTITYKLVLVILGIGVLVFRPASIMVYLEDVEPLMYIGLVLNVAFIVIMLLAVFSPSIVRSLAKFLFSLVQKVHRFRDPEAIMNRLEDSLQKYHGTSDFFRNNPRIIAHVFFITLVQRFCLFSVVWFTYVAFGLRGQSAFTMMMLYAMISVAVDMLPLPGGMGISETLFISIFEPIFGNAFVLPGMIVCRGISYYTQLLISAIMTGVAQLILRHKKK